MDQKQFEILRQEARLSSIDSSMIALIMFIFSLSFSILTSDFIKNLGQSVVYYLYFVTFGLLTIEGLRRYVIGVFSKDSGLKNRKEAISYLLYLATGLIFLEFCIMLILYLKISDHATIIGALIFSIIATTIVARTYFDQKIDVYFKNNFYHLIQE